MGLASSVRRALALLAVVVVAATAFWAGRVTLRPPEASEQSTPESAEIEVVEQELGQVITLTTTVSRPSAPLALNGLAGVVTSTMDRGEHGQGDLLYTVGQTPVVLVEGTTPFWRELGEEAQGEDVRQVQKLLIKDGADLAPDGRWGVGTTQAVRSWQQEHGYPVTGVFEQGSLVAAPDLPMNVAIDDQVAWPGAVLSGGEEVVMVADGDPVFAMEVTQAQAQLLPSGTEVSIDGGAAGWEGVITDSTGTEDGLIALTVTAPGGGLVCGDECADLPAAERTNLLTEVALVPPVSGPVVPVAAVTTNPDGTGTVNVVADVGVQARQVDVISVAGGLAVVDGVEVGERIRVFGTESATPVPPATPEVGDDTDTTGP